MATHFAGVDSLLVERSRELTRHPQAHYINNRTMEVLRPLAGLSKDIFKHSPPLNEWRSFLYCHSMTGHVLGEVDHFKGAKGDMTVCGIHLPELAGKQPSA